MLTCATPYAIGASHNGRPVGGFGSAEVFSRSSTKPMVAGEGGLVATNESDLAARLRVGRDHGNPGDYNTRFVGLNARMSEFHAAMALEALAMIDETLERRRQISLRYMTCLRDVPGIRVQVVPRDDMSTFKDFTIAIDPERTGRRLERMPGRRTPTDTLALRMKSTVEPLEGNKVKLSVAVDASEFEPAVDAAFKKIAREVRLPGFRPGKAPRKVLEARLGPLAGREQALHDSLPEYYSAAVIEHDVDVIAAPEIDITGGQEDGDIAFDAVVQVRPSIEVPGYGALSVTLERPGVDEEVLDAQIDRMRDLDGTLEVVQRPAQEGDTVTIDLAGTLDGDAQAGLTADDYSYTVGSGAITPEVDEQLVGAEAGATLSFAATHPDPAEERELQFELTLKDVKEKVLPEPTDEWASEASEFDTLAELRASLADRMERVRKAQAQMALREKVGEALAALVTDDVPEPMVGQEMQERLQDLAMRLQAQGMQLDQYLAMTGGDPETFSQELRDTATQAVKVDLALRAVADAESIECTEDDLRDDLEGVAERVGEVVDEVHERLERAGQMSAVRSDIRKRKALEWLLERVEVLDPEGATIDRSELELPSDEDEDDDSATDEVADTDETEEEAET